MTLQGLEQREVGAVVDLGEHPPEVAHGLVIVDRQGQGDSGGQGAVLCVMAGGVAPRVASGSRPPALGRRRRPWAVGGRTGRRQVQALGVLVEHPGRREAPDGAGDGVAHELHPPGGEAVPVPLVVGRDQLLLEDPVQVLRVGPVLGALVRVGLPASDGPAVVAHEALVPPPVEHAHVEHAVRGGLHAARAARLEGRRGCVEPDVDALRRGSASDPHVVVLEEHDAAAQSCGCGARRRCPG